MDNGGTGPVVKEGEVRRMLASANIAEARYSLDLLSASVLTAASQSHRLVQKSLGIAKGVMSKFYRSTPESIVRMSAPLLIDTRRSLLQRRNEQQEAASCLTRITRAIRKTKRVS